jgi:arginase family enzyme
VWAIETVFERLEVAAAAITAYDPGVDEDGRMAAAASRVIATVTRAALRSNPIDPPVGWAPSA